MTTTSSRFAVSGSGGESMAFARFPDDADRALFGVGESRGFAQESPEEIDDVVLAEGVNT